MKVFRKKDMFIFHNTFRWMDNCSSTRRRIYAVFRSPSNKSRKVIILYWTSKASKSSWNFKTIPISSIWLHKWTNIQLQVRFINIVRPCHLSERKKELPSPKPKPPITSLNFTVLVVRSGKRFAKQLRLRNNEETTVSYNISRV